MAYNGVNLHLLCFLYSFSINLQVAIANPRFSWLLQESLSADSNLWGEPMKVIFIKKLTNHKTRSTRLFEPAVDLLSNEATTIWLRNLPKYANDRGNWTFTRSNSSTGNKNSYKMVRTEIINGKMAITSLKIILQKYFFCRQTEFIRSIPLAQSSFWCMVFKTLRFFFSKWRLKHENRKFVEMAKNLA